MKNYIITVAFVCLMHLVVTECRSGWRTHANGYFVYEARKNFSKRNEILIRGTFSIFPNITSKKTILSVDDAARANTFQIMVAKGQFYTAYKKMDRNFEEKVWSAPAISEGYAFAFTVAVSRRNTSASGWKFSIVTDIAAVSAFAIEDINANWNFSTIKINVGGNIPDPVSAGLFEGCLSDVAFQGRDIISTYFKQYPNNTNPVRGKETFVNGGHGFSNVSERCTDAMLTTKAPVATTTTAVTTTDGWSTKSNVSTNVRLSTKGHTPTTKPTDAACVSQAFQITLIFCIWLGHAVM